MPAERKTIKQIGQIGHRQKHPTIAVSNISDTTLSLQRPKRSLMMDSLSLTYPGIFKKALKVFQNKLDINVFGL